MAGAYVAKPAVVSVPDVPPGWNPNWPFPGPPWPPGYTPALSYTLVTGETYAPGATHDATATLYDQITYETSEPNNPMFWTAKMNGVTVGLKLDGDADWSERLVIDHSPIGSYGAAPTLRFNVSEDDEGEIIILQAVSTPFNNALGCEAVRAEIEVVAAHAQTAKLTITMDGYKGQWLEEWNVYPWVGQLRWTSSQFGLETYFGNNTGYGHAPYGTTSLKHWNDHEDGSDDPHWIFNHASSSTVDFEMTCPAGDVRGYGCDYPRIIGNSGEGISIIKAIQIRPYMTFPWQPLTYEVKYKRLTSLVEPGSEATFNLLFELFDENDNLLSSYTKSFTTGHIVVGDSSWQEWLTLDGTSKEVTVINP